MSDSKEDSGFIAKTLSGRPDLYNAGDGYEAASAASSFAGLPGDVVNVGISWFAGDWSANHEKEQLSRELGINLDSLHAATNPGIRRKIEDLGKRSWNGMGSAAVGLGGAVAGGAAAAGLGSMIFPGVGTVGGWLLGAGGSIAGGMTGNGLYNRAMVKRVQDAVSLTAQIRSAQKAGARDIPPEVVFAALASNLPSRTGRLLEKRLKAKTGTRLFNEAVELGAQDNYRVLRDLMKDPFIDSEIRVATGMLSDLNNPNKSASEQYAELINSGRLDAKYLLFNNDPITMIAQVNAGTASLGSPQPTLAVPPLTPEMHSIAGDLSQTGVSMAREGEQLPPLPYSRSGHTRST